MLREKVVFIYNIDKNIIDKISSSLYDMFFLESDVCRLYELLHNKHKIKEEWTDFIDGADFDGEMLYRDMFLKSFESYNIYDKNGNKMTIKDITYPTVFIIPDAGINEMYQIITPESAGRCKNTSCFQTTVNKKIETFRKLHENNFSSGIMKKDERFKDESDKDNFIKSTDWKTKKEIREKIKNRML